MKGRDLLLELGDNVVLDGVVVAKELVTGDVDEGNPEDNTYFVYEVDIGAEFNVELKSNIHTQTAFANVSDLVYYQKGRIAERLKENEVEVLKLKEELDRLERLS